MLMIHQELKQLTWGQNEIEDKLQDQQAQVRVAVEYTSRNVNSSTLLLDDSAITLTQHLASLKDITKRLQEDETACHPLYAKVKDLETLMFFEEERRTNAVNLRQDRFEELQQLHWMQARDRLDGHERDMGSIKDQHATFEAEVREIVKRLESNSQVTPASLQENITASIAELTDRVQSAEKAATSLSSTFTTLTEGQIRLGNRQTSLEQIILRHFARKETADVQIDATEGIAEVGRKEMADVQIDATEGTAEVGIKGTVDIGTNTEGPISLNAEVKASLAAPTYLALNPAVANRVRSRSPTTYTVGSRKSPRLIQPPLGKSPG